MNSNLIRSLCLILALLLCYGDTQCVPPAQATCSCFNTSFGFEVDCSLVNDPSLNFLNSSALLNTTTLKLSGNNLTTISSRALTAVTKITYLFLNNNELTTLSPELFAPVSHLYHLDLSHNHLTNLPSNTFQDLFRLGILDLSFNGISVLPSGLFSPVRAIKELFVYNNVITSLAPDTLSGLHSLQDFFVYNNMLTEVPSDLFLDTEEMSHIDFFNNSLTVFPTKAVEPLRVLKYCDFSDNAFTTLESDSIPVLPRVRVLDVSFNHIVNIDPSAFRGISHVTDVRLAGNKLSQLSGGMFQGISKVQILDLSHNKLQNLSASVFEGLSNLNTLLLFNNQIKWIDDSAFMPFATTIRSLSLHANHLQSIDFMKVIPPFPGPRIVQLGANELKNPQEVFQVWRPFQINIPFPDWTYSGNPVTCVANGNSRETDLSCMCAQPYQLRKGLCLPPKPTDLTAEIVGSALGGVFGGVFLVLFVLWFRRRYKGLKSELELSLGLLDYHATENIELRQAWGIDPLDIQLVRRIDGDSPGTFGEVYFGHWDDLQVAVKKLRLTYMDDTAAEQFEREVDLLRKSRHRNIVRFFGAGTWTDNLPFLVTEFMENGSLDSFLRKERSISLWQKLQWCRDIQAGMEWIHVSGRVHRDLKCGNVLLSGKLRAKVADFGSMKGLLQNAIRMPTRRDSKKFIRESPSLASSLTSLGELTGSRAATAAVGTPLYMAPESIRDDEFAASADVWGFGVVMWEISMQQTPDLQNFHSNLDWSGVYMQRLGSALVMGHRLPLDDVPEALRGIILACWELLPAGRPEMWKLGEMLADVEESVKNNSQG